MLVTLCPVNADTNIIGESCKKPKLCLILPSKGIAVKASLVRVICFILNKLSGKYLYYKQS